MAHTNDVLATGVLCQCGHDYAVHRLEEFETGVAVRIHECYECSCEKFTRSKNIVKREIEFVGWAKSLIQDDFAFSAVVSFEWDGICDIMKPAFEALENKMRQIEYRDIIDYKVSDWRWIK
jgi:hypothetical protein